MEVSGTPVAFSAESDWKNLQPASRASDFNAGATMGVFAFYLPKGTTSIDNMIPNFMNNTTVTKGDNGNWTYSPLKYWPNNAGDKIQFYAYHPMSSVTDEISVSGNTRKGNPTITYTLTNGKTDLLAAAPEALEKQDKVTFCFQHILGQVNVKVKTDNDYVWFDNESIKVSSVTLKSVCRSGTYNFEEWSSLSGTQDLKIISGSTFTASTTTDGSVNGFPVYLLPTALSKLQLVLESTVDGTVISETINCPLESSISVVPNGNYVITIILNRDETGFTLSANWENTEEHTIIYDGNEIVHKR